MENIEAFAAKNKCYQTATPLYPQVITLPYTMRAWHCTCANLKATLKPK